MSLWKILIPLFFPDSLIWQVFFPLSLPRFIAISHHPGPGWGLIIVSVLRFADIIRAEQGDMQRIGFVFRIASSRTAAFKAHHQRVWPEMKATLQKHGWHNYPF